MIALRNISFYFFSIVLLLLFGLTIPIIYILKSEWLSLQLARLWTGTIGRFINVFLGIRFQVEGDMPDLTKPYLIISNHQSAWETIVFYNLFKCPVFIAKRELGKIPIFGWFMNAIGFILIDRAKPRHALSMVVSRGKSVVENGRSIVIFPEGTRVPPDKEVSFHSGYALLYKTLGIPALLVAHNSGCLCSEQYTFKYPGTITVKVIREIPPGMPIHEFTKIVEATLNSEKKILVERSDSEFWHHASE